jgi:hypothetical protein
VAGCCGGSGGGGGVRVLKATGGLVWCRNQLSFADAISHFFVFQFKSEHIHLDYICNMRRGILRRTTGASRFCVEARLLFALFHIVIRKSFGAGFRGIGWSGWVTCEEMSWVSWEIDVSCS